MKITLVLALVSVTLLMGLFWMRDRVRAGNLLADAAAPDTHYRQVPDDLDRLSSITVDPINRICHGITRKSTGKIISFTQVPPSPARW